MLGEVLFVLCVLFLDGKEVHQVWRPFIAKLFFRNIFFTKFLTNE